MAFAAYAVSRILVQLVAFVWSGGHVPLGLGAYFVFQPFVYLHDFLARELALLSAVFFLI